MTEVDSNNLPVKIADLRQQILAVIAHFDECEARSGQALRIGELLLIARGFQPPPVSCQNLIRDLSGPGEDQQLTVVVVADLINALAEWQNKLQITPHRVAGAPQLPSLGIAPQFPIPENSPSPSPARAPKDWRLAVNEIRAELLTGTSTGYFGNGMLPRLLWHSVWSEAYSVVSENESNDRHVVVIPNQQAAFSQDAHQWWQKKVAAGRMQMERQIEHVWWNQVLQAGSEDEPTFVILEGTASAPTLAEVVERRTVHTHSDQVEIAIGLCTAIECASDRGVSVLDLPADAVQVSWQPGLKMTRLTDVTAVIPADNFLPEWCLGGPPPVADKTRSVGQSQVFLLAASLLASLRADFQFCRAGAPGAVGRSASFALLAGQKGLCGHDPDLVTDSLVYELERSPGKGGVAIIQLVNILRWALADRPSERYSSPRELARLLRSCLL